MVGKWGSWSFVRFLWILILISGVPWTGNVRAQQQIAITFDDLPSHGPLPPGQTRIDIARHVIRALQAAHVPPTYGFVNGLEVQQHPETAAVLAEWRGAGFPLGNHTWSHMNLNQNSIQDFEQNILKNEPLLQLQMKGKDWHWLRYPFLAEGETPAKQMAIRAFLAEHGYKIAGVTMSFRDYEWNEPYARCVSQHNTREIAWLEKSYLQAADQDITYTRKMSKILYGKDIPYVLLMHIGALDARMLPRLLRLYHKRGFTFISLEQAEAGPFYRYDADPKQLPGPDSLEEVMAQKHLPLPPFSTPEEKLNAVCR